MYTLSARKILNQDFKSKIEKKKSTREVQILKLRSEWNELLLNKSKRDAFFETKFKAQYDDNFFEFLLVKTNAIIDVINAKLPMTQLEEVPQTIRYIELIILIMIDIIS